MLDRRSVLSALALAATAPLAARAGGEAGFTHGIASGEPGPDRITLWTRHVARGPTPLTVEVAADEGFARPVARARATARPDADHTARVEVGGLRPGRFHWYRFRAPDGALSPVGRAKTLPAGRPDMFRVAMFSCSNLPFGYFNAYAHAAARDDLDCWLHLGDYLYEYPPGTYPTAAETVGGRVPRPPRELLALADYRVRHGLYRADSDLQALHARLPAITQWDDHEIANDAWTGGAGNHDPSEGPWRARVGAATRAYREWLPVGCAPYRAYQAGDLVTLLKLETRLTGRDRQLDLAAAAGPDPLAALVRLRDGPLADVRRSLLGARQERWVARELARSAGAGTRWQALAQQVLVNGYLTPPDAAGWLPADAPAAARARVEAALLAARAGLSSTDNWNGYPAARDRLLGAAQAAGANLVTLAGDSHNAWASDLARGGRPAGVEFGTTSVTAPGLESARLGAPPTASPAEVAAAVVRATPGLRWADTSRRGYTVVTFARDRVTADFHLLDTVRQRSTALAATRTLTAEYGANRLA